MTTTKHEHPSHNSNNAVDTTPAVTPTVTSDHSGNVDTSTQAYRDSVEADFKKRGFCLCSFKGKNNWYEILDGPFHWDTFDYKMAPYPHSKSLNDVINNDNGNAIKNIEDFVNNKN
jgi:hypothetical protein